ncbi:VOC family protein [candidate division KSB1 bacterium]|nr:VOC family protein [candidate division KSB1 bacterium]
MSHFTPYLMFDGNCEEAMQFYRACFGGELGYFCRYGDAPMEVPVEQQTKIMHVEFKFWGGSIMACDHLQREDVFLPKAGTNMHLSLGFESGRVMKKTFDRLKEGGNVTMEVREQFWGDKFGMLTDKYGVNWMFSCAGNKSK